MNRYAPPTRILLISHAATREQREGRFPMDEAVDPETLLKLSTSAWSLPAFEQVWTAPEQRTRQTAAVLGLKADVQHELRDCSYGAWAGSSLEEVNEHHSAELSSWLSDVTAAPHGGESFENVMQRTARWLDALRGHGPAIAVTHASVIRAAVVHALGAPREALRRVEISPLTVTDLRQSGQSWQLRSAGVPLALASAELRRQDDL